ncbi:molecular chaperone DnaJ [Nocardia sp. 852002-20019_SCH5090214]|uniref:DUF1992 domain-containing protein n=1 Tax=Nocardia nova TaxID=37330 RepID=A0A2S6A5N8_9NOCA|nr:MULTISPECIES: DUF1992 domain-containing protein [Nocardia]OBF67809.1 molecular chaperone DnaJ [Mycobacterium sp. 852002-51759_SCH5129042]MBF6275246.1 DUF1992 domain-containing protein [Nocardia nova]MBV7703012.1 DUF1992 domain-containing protein [Nocardia nova]OBA50003.1 molecular chaperone DnaJ [Nocardia sp. 852002-51101_SCH5132738]OBA66509.1 molecular chaperone DnaJ [Nocardia sp. 852002-20019_SCH5090214]
MTERKPAGMGFESWIDKQIREATERGEFDNLAGTGKPLPGVGEPYDENWWLNNYLRREGVGGEALLPTSLVLRRDLERLPERVAEMDSEAEVRAYVSDLNIRIVEWIRMPHGPHVRLAPARADEVVARWRADRHTRQRTAAPSGKDSLATTSTRRRDGHPRWWRRLLRRDRPGAA